MSSTASGNEPARWFRQAIGRGLQALVVLHLPGAPGHETVGHTRDVWVATLWDAPIQWSEKLDATRIEAAFKRIARLAEVIGEYLSKGSKAYIEGSLRTRKWQDKDGVDRYTTEIIVSEMQMLDSKGAKPQQQARQESAPKPKGGDDFDDDIPFAALHWMNGG